MFRRNKRGMEDKLYFLIWEIIALVIVFSLITMAVRSIANSSTYWKKYYSVDVGLMADIENINQGNFVMNYKLKSQEDVPQNQVLFEFILTNKRMEVYDAPRTDTSYPISWPYAKARTITINNQSAVTDFLVLSKIGSELKLGTYEPTITESCPSFDTGETLGNTTAFDALALTSQVQSYADSFKSVIKEYGSDKNALNQFTIIFTSTKDPDVKIYYADDENTLKSQKFACMIASAYSKNFVSNAKTMQYDGFLDNDEKLKPTFDTYIASLKTDPKRSKESWIIISMNDESLKINHNDFAIFLKGQLLEYYSQNLKK